MPRTSRSVAQRLAAQRSSKKRRPARTGAPAPAQPSEVAPPLNEPTGVSVDQILDEVVPSAGGARAAVTPTTIAPSAASTPATLRRAAVAARRASAKPAAPRRRFSEYAADYAYVWADLRRVLLVAGVLTALLIVTAFFIE